MPPVILVVDDEPSIRRTLREIFEYEGFGVEEAVDGEEALARLRAGRYDVVMLDVNMPKRDGMEVLAVAREETPETPIVMLSGHGAIETAVKATKLGAYDFIEKPPDLNRLLVSVRNAMDRGVLATANRRMQEAIHAYEGELTPILGDSSAIGAVRDTIERVAPSEARVLITGDPGTGKELVAKWIRHLSPRKDGPMVDVNCAAIPDELIESELFGHEKGAFTGAVKQRIGKFEQADGGTLFLDEIGDMSLSAQAKVLRVLQENNIQRVGGDRVIPVDVRIVCATNKDLAACIREETFREDLYYRLSVIPIHLPTLRERVEDIPVIAARFCEDLARRNGRPGKHFAASALRRLMEQEWRGNVRELQNVIERLIVLTTDDEIRVEDIDRYAFPGETSWDPLMDLLARTEDWGDFRDAAEKMFLERKLNDFDWNISRTAEAIGMQRSHLYNKMNKYGIEREEGA